MSKILVALAFVAGACVGWRAGTEWVPALRKALLDWWTDVVRQAVAKLPPEAQKKALNSTAD